MQAQQGHFIRGFLPFINDIKIAHSIFALPFALSAFYINPLPVPTAFQCVFLLTCMVSARSFAMGMNRLIDAKIDGLNPRTQLRALPSGQINLKQSLFWNFLFALVFIFSSFQLSLRAGLLSVPLLVVLALYGKMKLLTTQVHFYLGVCLGLAPLAVTIALNQTPSLALFLLCLAIVVWTAGFDILYALQDRIFDLQQGLRSIPVRFGVRGSLLISRLCFATMIVLLWFIGVLDQFGLIYNIGIIVIACFLIYEHILINDSNEVQISKNLNVAFFNANAAVSILFLVFTLLDRFL